MPVFSSPWGASLLAPAATGTGFVNPQRGCTPTKFSSKFRTSPTETILQQKKTSFVRKIDLKYTVDSRLVRASQEQLDAIAADIAATQAKLEADEREASLYSGGLIQGLALATVAAHRLTLAQLHLSYLGAKYGFVLPQVQPSSVDKKEDEPPGTPVPDDQAFE